VCAEGALTWGLKEFNVGSWKVELILSCLIGYYYFNQKYRKQKVKIDYVSIT
jgi:hypothetical protein